MGKWQLINTLPEIAMSVLIEGRGESPFVPVLIYCVSYDDTSAVFHAHWSVDDECWYVPNPQDGKSGSWMDLHKWEPTHWMMLPEAPQ